MRFLLFLGVALLFTLAFADHHKHHKDDHDDHDPHDHKDDHDSHDHDDKKHHPHNESLPSYKLFQFNHQFYIDLYKQVARDQPTGNIVLSPPSIATAFAFLSLGAKSASHTQIIEGLRFNTSKISEQEIHDGFHNLMHLLNDEDRELKVSFGNALFVSKEHNILQPFIDGAKKFYHSEAFSTDFKNTEEATDQINSYVAKQTHDKIPKLLDNVNPEAIFVLMNYFYFKGTWENQFDEKFTKEGDFHVDENTIVKVPFMTRTGMYNVAITDKFTCLFIPYKGNAHALVIMPNHGEMAELEQGLSKEKGDQWRKMMKKRLIELHFPKFSLSGTVNLKEILSKLGIEDVFSDNADLSGITGEANIKISKAVHKAVITVDETGTEGSASTALEGVPMMVPTRVEINRPFLFALQQYNPRSLPITVRVANPLK